jgi:hypothetical protein
MRAGSAMSLSRGPRQCGMACVASRKPRLCDGAREPSEAGAVSTSGARDRARVSAGGATGSPLRCGQSSACPSAGASAPQLGERVLHVSAGRTPLPTRLIGHLFGPQPIHDASLPTRAQSRTSAPRWVVVLSTRSQGVPKHERIHREVSLMGNLRTPLAAQHQGGAAAHRPRRCEA